MTLPVAILLTRYVASYELIHVGFAIPLAVALGATAVKLARDARAFDDVMLGRAGGARIARIGRLLGALGLCMAASATISLCVYGLLISLD